MHKTSCYQHMNRIPMVNRNLCLSTTNTRQMKHTKEMVLPLIYDRMMLGFFSFSVSFSRLLFLTRQVVRGEFQLIRSNRAQLSIFQLEIKLRTRYYLAIFRIQVHDRQYAALRLPHYKDPFANFMWFVLEELVINCELMMTTHNGRRQSQNPCKVLHGHSSYAILFLRNPNPIECDWKDTAPYQATNQSK